MIIDKQLIIISLSVYTFYWEDRKRGNLAVIPWKYIHTAITENPSGLPHIGLHTGFPETGNNPLTKSWLGQSYAYSGEELEHAAPKPNMEP
jgi:hypothetical protein